MTAAACFACTMPLFLFVSDKATFSGLFSDSAIYILLADAYATRGSGFDWLGFLHSNYPFPPGYPLALVLSGGGTDNVAWTHRLGGLTMGLCSALTAYWLCRERVSIWLGGFAAVLFALMPISLFYAMDVMSEPLYLLLTLTAMTVLGADRVTSSGWVAAAVLIGIAAVVRTVGVTAIAAFVVFWWYRTHGTRYRAAPFFALAPTLAWALVKWTAGYEPSYVMSVITFPLSEAITALAVEIPSNVASLWSEGLANLDVIGHSFSAACFAPVLLFVLAGFLRRLRRGCFDAIYIVAYLALVVVWPHNAHAGRFVFVLIPLGLLYAVTGGAVFAERFVRGSGSAARAAPVILLAAIVLPSSAEIVRDIAAETDGIYHDAVRTSTWHWTHDVEVMHDDADIVRQITAAIVTLGTTVEPGECIISVLPQYVMLATGRPALYPASPDATATELDRSVQQCPYVLMLNATSEPFGFPDQFYPRDRIGDGFDEIAVINYVDVAPAPAAAAILMRRSETGE